VLERGNLPLGFNNHEQFREFGRTTWDGLRAAGYDDAEPYLRGSAVTGHNFRTGTPFDGVERSDLDLAIVSPILMRRAIDEGVPLRGGARTQTLTEPQIDRLGLRDIVTRSSAQTGRSVTIMIYDTTPALTRRGPFVQIP
jgi:hypothetical protein